MRGRTGTALVRCAPPEPLGNELKHCYRRRSRRCEERCRKAAVEAPLRSPLSARQGLGAPTSPFPYATRTPFWSLPKRVSGRRAAQKPRSVLTQTGRSLPKREKRALVLTWTDLPRKMPPEHQHTRHESRQKDSPTNNPARTYPPSLTGPLTANSVSLFLSGVAPARSWWSWRADGHQGPGSGSCQRWTEGHLREGKEVEWC